MVTDMGSEMNDAYVNDVRDALENKPVKSEGSAAIYFRVPASIILDREADNARVSAFSFFSVRRDIENVVTFTLNGMAKWLGRKPDRHSGGTNDRMSQCVSNLKERGIISVSGKIGNASEADATLNVDGITKECNENIFAVIYLDELRKIMSHDVKSADSTLLVFSWLRMRIIRRRNRLFQEEMAYGSHETNVIKRRLRSPEAYDCYCYEIADELGISTRMASKAIDNLNKLGLIYSEQLPNERYKLGDGQNETRWKTGRTIFCNRYKRENGSFLDGGIEYYSREIENKKKKLTNLKNKNGDV
jgi:hypothetical protein